MYIFAIMQLSTLALLGFTVLAPSCVLGYFFIMSVEAPNRFSFYRYFGGIGLWSIAFLAAGTIIIDLVMKSVL